jgi:hypothetical protein
MAVETAGLLAEMTSCISTAANPAVRVQPSEDVPGVPGSCRPAESAFVNSPNHSLAAGDCQANQRKPTAGPARVRDVAEGRISVAEEHRAGTDIARSNDPARKGVSLCVSTLEAGIVDAVVGSQLACESDHLRRQADAPCDAALPGGWLAARGSITRRRLPKESDRRSAVRSNPPTARPGSRPCIACRGSRGGRQARCGPAVCRAAEAAPTD